jgi:hypothetical protein
MAISGRRLFVGIFLFLLLVLACMRLWSFVVHFDHSSLQMDFSAYYTAGESLDHGLSPYVNNVSQQIWDGTDGYRHSRFLYPPLVAALFQPLALVHYRTAKLIWMLFALGALAGSLVAVLSAARVRAWPEAALAAAVVAATFHPLLTLLERGQMDTVTLLLLALAMRLLPEGGTLEGLGGALMACAALLKLNVAEIVAFVLVRRRWRAALGFAAGAVCLLGVSLVVPGPGSLQDYLHVQLPRIERFGEGGTGAMQLPKGALRTLTAGVPNGWTIKDGVRYPLAYFGFQANATVVRLRWHGALARLTGTKLSEALAIRAAVLMGLLELLDLGLVGLRRRADLRRKDAQIERGWGWFLEWARVRRGPPPDKEAARDELIYWHMVLMILLLCGPLTWVMNVVWMVPVFVLVWALAEDVRTPGQAFWLTVVLLGFFWAWLPDTNAFPMLGPFGMHWKWINGYKYLAAEGAVLVGLGGVLVCRRLAARERAPA